MGIAREKLKERMSTTLRNLLKQKEIIVEASVYNPFAAMLAEKLGFKCCWTAGQGLGEMHCTTENLMTMTEYAYFAREITDAISIPLIVDVGCGIPEEYTYILRCVRLFERAGVAGIAISDQHQPKVMTHFQIPFVEYVIPSEKMVLKIKSALRARQDPDLMIVVSSGARNAVGGSVEEYIRRLKIYEEAGADMLRGISGDIDTLKKIREMIHIPLESGMSADAAPGVRGPKTPELLQELGYNMTRTTLMSMAVQYRATKELFLNVLNRRPLGLTIDENNQIRQDMLANIDTPKLIEEELKTYTPPYTGKAPS